MCFYKNVSVDEVEVKVLPHITVSGQGSQSQSELDNSFQPDSEDDYADAHYLRFLESSKMFSFS